MNPTANSETISALTAASDQYEEALARNDIDTLDALFSNEPHVIRLGATENLFGAAEIAMFRRARSGGAPPRERLRREIVALSPEAGCVTVIFRNLSTGQIGRQTQCWTFSNGRWTVLVAHVSFLV